MAHVEKYTRGAMGSMLAHYNRTKASSTSIIDPSRTHLNYNLAAKDQPYSQYDFIHIRLSEIKVHNRKDVNVFCDWIVTAPRELNPDEYDLFFRETYDFLCNRYGRENVISAYVHMDETQPHIHFAFVPVAIDKKKNIPKLSAKEVITRRELKSFHTDLSKHMQNVFGRDIGILNGATEIGNLTIPELRKRSENALMLDETILKEKADELEHNRSKKLFKADSVTFSGEEFEQTRKTLQEAATVLSAAETINAAVKKKSEQADAFYTKAKDKLASAEIYADKIVSDAETKAERQIAHSQWMAEQFEKERSVKQAALDKRKSELDEKSQAVADMQATVEAMRQFNEETAEKNRQDAEYTKGWWHTCKVREQKLDEREKALDERTDHPHDFYNGIIREQWETIERRDKNIRLLKDTISQKDEKLEEAADIIHGMEVLVADRDNEIAVLNRVLSDTEVAHAKELIRKDEEKEAAVSLVREETEKAVTSRFEALLAEANHKISALTEKVGRAFDFIRSICVSVAKFGYNDDEYRVQFSKHQRHLFDAILNFGSRVCRENDFEKEASAIETYAGITKGVREEMDKIPLAEEKVKKNDDFCL